MRLLHFRLNGIARYEQVARLQDSLVAAQLRRKARGALEPLPDPAVITTQFHPVYTCGRRELGTISPAEQDYLRDNGRADFVEARRGGQLTFHGPGQLVAYPILDLKRHRLSSRCYVHLLEECVIKTCSKYSVSGVRTENPGVWTSSEDKLCAVGVHLRRHISSHGIALNVSTDLDWFERIVACGLEGKRTTSLLEHGLKDVGISEVTQTFVQILAQQLDTSDISLIEVPILESGEAQIPDNP